MSLHDPKRTDVNVAIVGVGNCASSLVQGIAHYSNGGANEQIGLSHWDLGGYRPKDLKIVAAWDIDKRKVGRDVAEAIFAPPNCTTVFCDHVPETGTRVRMGKQLDGIADHMTNFPDERTFMLADGQLEPSHDDVVGVLRDTNADVMINYLPVGSQKAAEFYAECALESTASRYSSPAMKAGRSGSRMRASPSSATTSSRSSARPSSTACSPICSRSAA